MIIPIVPSVFLVVGVLMYALASSNPKVAEIGRILFAAGALTFAYGFHV